MCQEGYESELCATCSTGYFKDSSSYCETCPNLVALRIVLVVAFIIVGLGSPMMVSKKGLHTISITTAYMQVLFIRLEDANCD